MPLTGSRGGSPARLTRTHFWSEGYGQIYPTLKQLASAGVVTSRVEPGRGKPDRHVYTLTPTGRDELRRWLARPAESMQAGRSELLLKIFFGRHAPTARISSGATSSGAASFLSGGSRSEARCSGARRAPLIR